MPLLNSSPGHSGFPDKHPRISSLRSFILIMMYPSECFIKTHNHLVRVYTTLHITAEINRKPQIRSSVTGFTGTVLNKSSLLQSHKPPRLFFTDWHQSRSLQQQFTYTPVGIIFISTAWVMVWQHGRKCCKGAHLYTPVPSARKALYAQKVLPRALIASIPLFLVHSTEWRWRNRELKMFFMESVPASGRFSHSWRVYLLLRSSFEFTVNLRDLKTGKIWVRFQRIKDTEAKTIRGSALCVSPAH